MGEVTITVKIPAEKKDQLKALSLQTGVQVGSLVREAIYKKIEHELKEVK